ncbi:hypothetical protein MLD38_000832 [Melastoma candidum]|uniref:Uncharacterized protein n=1 Tax=Melastoma candidum TaxID=119954 RepID=A0ACB9SDB9_9MYRT|nr:hypothetical protein MLD38_000832 [Melastoma candidum]
MSPMGDNGECPATVSDSVMDLDFMDNLLLDGCWLETMNGLDSLQNSPPSFSAPFDAPFSLPDNPGSGIGNSAPPPSQRGYGARDEAPRNPCEDFGLDKLVNDGADLRRSWWIRPQSSPGPSTPVMRRLMRALEYIHDFAKDKDVLIQLWVPVNRGNKRVLTTNKQPFYLDHSSGKLSRYREISENYQFSAEEDSKELVGLPSRVFFGKVLEWSPDVRFFKSEEYPRLDHAQQFDVRGTLAVPVFEQGSRTCLGVIEVVMTTQKIMYRPEIETVCKALEAVDLRSSGSCSSPSYEPILMPYDALVPEIKEVLKSACEAHKLPLAQTWASCIQQGREGCRHSEETYIRCVSTIDCACHVANTRVHGFHEACSEYHLLKGQGVAGKAFLTNRPCFLSDITSSSKMEYPLAHHAAIFGLRAAVAIRLRSIYEGSADFVLEFFLPSECRNVDEQKKLLASLSVIIQQTCKNLRVITNKELEDEGIMLDHKSNRERSTARSEKEIIDVEESLDRRRLPDSLAEGGLLGEASCSKAAMAKKGNRKRSKAEKSITLEALRQYFSGSLKEAAKGLGVCPTTLKRICRQHGIKRWPSRKIKKVDHSLQKLQHVINSVQGAPSSLQIGSFYKEFPDLASPNVITTRSSNAKPNDPSKSSRSPSLSCSLGSNSSHGCSSGERQNPSVADVNGEDNNIVREDGDDVDGTQLRRVRSHGELNGSSTKEAEEASKFLPRSQSYKSFELDPESLLPSPEKPTQNAQGEGLPLRIKASYAGDKVRFRLQPHWSLSELWRELATRFNIEDISIFDLKYLDDDSEWVLLTCDADLAECMDLCRSSHSDTVKLSVEASYQGRRLVSSWGSSSGFL